MRTVPSLSMQSYFAFRIDDYRNFDLRANHFRDDGLTQAIKPMIADLPIDCPSYDISRMVYGVTWPRRQLQFASFAGSERRLKRAMSKGAMEPNREHLGIR